MSTLSYDYIRRSRLKPCLALVATGSGPHLVVRNPTRWPAYRKDGQKGS